MRYGTQPELLQDVSMHLEPGSFHFLTGPSGSGKTSILRLIGLLHRPTSGTIQILGKPTHQLRRNQRAMLRRRIGTVYQDFRLMDHLTVAENIALPLKIAGMPLSEAHANVRELLHWMKMEGMEHLMPRSLSGGEMQRVAVARAVVHRPDIILADEPTGNLDGELSMQLMYLLRALNEMHHTTIMVATHDMGLVGKFTYPVLSLEQGKLKRK
jgi:cell division transport system ATP-binding protein